MKQLNEINDIIYENKHIKINIHLRDRRVLIEGDSSTGKSLFVNKIKIQIDGAKVLNEIDNDYSQMVVFSYKYNNSLYKICELLRNIKNKLIIIDNADILLDNNDIDYINNDWDNKYVIIGRGLDTLQIMPNSIGHIEKFGLPDGRTEFKLVYNE